MTLYSSNHIKTPENKQFSGEIFLIKKIFDNLKTIYQKDEFIMGLKL